MKSIEKEIKKAIKKFRQDSKKYRSGEITIETFRIYITLHKLTAGILKNTLQILIGGALFGKDFLTKFYTIQLIDKNEVVRLLPELNELIEKGSAESKELVKKKLREMQQELKVFFEEIEEIKQEIGKDIKCCMDCGEEEDLSWTGYYWLCEDCKEDREPLLPEPEFSVDDI